MLDTGQVSITFMGGPFGPNCQSSAVPSGTLGTSQIFFQFKLKDSAAALSAPNGSFPQSLKSLGWAGKWMEVMKHNLVGGFLHPSEKYDRTKLDHLPRDRGRNSKKKMSCHHQSQSISAISSPHRPILTSFWNGIWLMGKICQRDVIIRFAHVLKTGEKKTLQLYSSDTPKKN